MLTKIAENWGNLYATVSYQTLHDCKESQFLIEVQQSQLRALRNLTGFTLHVLHYYVRLY